MMLPFSRVVAASVGLWFGFLCTNAFLAWRGILTWNQATGPVVFLAVFIGALLLLLHGFSR